MALWWQQPQRIVQTNLRLTDADLDCRQVAREVRELGGTAMFFNVGGIYAWYPTKLPLHALNPFLKRDLVGEMIEACDKEGVHFIGRFDLSKGTGLAYDAHPDWFCHTIDGRPFEYNGSYQASITGAWYNEQSLAVMSEVLERYKFDAAFFNMFGYQRQSYGYEDWGFSHDPSAIAAFAEFSGGLAIPGQKDFANPAYRLYLQFQDKTTADLSRKVYDHVKSIRPDFGMANLSGWRDWIRMESNRAVVRAQPEWPHQTGENARFAQSVSRGTVPYTVALTNYFDFHWRNTSENENFQINRMAQALANGAEPHYYFMGPVGAQVDRKPMAAMADIFQFHARNQALYDGLLPAGRVALYQSKTTDRYGRLDAKMSTKPEPGPAYYGAYRALLESGIAFDIVSDRIAGDPDFAETLAAYDLLILPDVTCIGDNEAAAIDAFVADGGNLLATGQTGTLTQYGERRQANALSSLPIARVIENRTDTASSYMIVGEGELDFPLTTAIMLDGPYGLVEPRPGTETLLRVQPPQRFGPPELAYPEAPVSDEPGILIGRHGQGQVAFLPWSPDRIFYKYSLVEHRQVIAQLVERLSATPVRMEGASRMEMTLRRHEQTGEIAVHLINYSGQSGNNYASPIAQHGVRLGVKGTADLPAAALVSGTAVSPGPQDTDGYRWFALPPIGHFEAIVFKPQPTA